MLTAFGMYVIKWGGGGGSSIVDLRIFFYPTRQRKAPTLGLIYRVHPFKNVYIFNDLDEN